MAAAEYITHTLACQQCIDAGVAQRCIHNLSHIPPWKSILKLGQIRRLYPKKMVSAGGSGIYGVSDRDLLTRLPPATRF